MSKAEKHVGRTLHRDARRVWPHPDPKPLRAARGTKDVKRYGMEYDWTGFVGQRRKSREWFATAKARDQALAHHNTVKYRTYSFYGLAVEVKR